MALLCFIQIFLGDCAMLLLKEGYPRLAGLLNLLDSAAPGVFPNITHLLGKFFLNHHSEFQIHAYHLSPLFYPSSSALRLIQY